MRVATHIAVMLFLLIVGSFGVGRFGWNQELSAQAAGNRTTTGEFVIDPPTLINLGFEWFIEGDDNRNAAVAVRYRERVAVTVRHSVLHPPCGRHLQGVP